MVGRVRVKVAPEPGGLWAVRVPPWPSAMALAKGRPRPIPGVWVAGLR